MSDHRGVEDLLKAEEEAKLIIESAIKERYRKIFDFVPKFQKFQKTN